MLNAYAADNAIIALNVADSSWNPAIDKQALARVWRDGQSKHTYVYRLVSTHTIEEKVLQRQLLKEDMATSLHDARASVAGHSRAHDKGFRFSSEELRALFALDPLAPEQCDTALVVQAALSRSDKQRRIHTWRDADVDPGAARADSPQTEHITCSEVSKPGLHTQWTRWPGPQAIVDTSLRTVALTAIDESGCERHALISYVREVHVTRPADWSAQSVLATIPDSAGPHCEGMVDDLARDEETLDLGE